MVGRAGEMRARALLLAALTCSAACAAEPEAPRAAPPAGPASGSASVDAPVASAAPSAAASARPAASASAAAAPSAGSALPDKVVELDEKERALGGRTLDFPYDGKDLHDRSRAYTGRIFVHERALRARGKLPLVVFFHGLNKQLIPHRWMGGGDEGDVRKIAGELMQDGRVAPFVLAGPGSVQKDAVSEVASFPRFDLARFVAQVEEHLGDAAAIDRERVVVVGHSGAGCSEKGGIVSALELDPAPFAIVSIDTCMGASLARALAAAGPRTHVVVTWQKTSWAREFAGFRREFEKVAQDHPAEGKTLRVLDELPSLARAHDATVKQTFDKHLPILLGRAP